MIYILYFENDYEMCYKMNHIDNNKNIITKHNIHNNNI